MSYLLTDAQDNTRAMLNPAGAVTTTFNYSAFGNPVGFSMATAPTSILFQQTMYDAPSGLNVFGDGTRQEEVGEDNFMESDSTGYSNNNNPITLNPYLLDNADAINFVDLNGHDGTEAEELGVAGIAAQLFAGVEPLIARISIQTAIIATQLMDWAPAIYGGLAIGGLALEALDSIAQNLSGANLQIPANAANDYRGNLIEDTALEGENGALDHNFPRIDYFNNGFALSIKSHSLGSTDALLGAIRGDLNDISDIQNERLPGYYRDGSPLVIRPGMIQTKALLVAIPGTDASAVLQSGFTEDIQALSEEYETAIKIVGIEGWEN